MVWLSDSERRTLIVLGVIGLGALGTLLWLQRRPPLTVDGLPAQAAAWDQRLAAARQVDVNTASTAELARLPGIGPALADRIVTYRTVHGAFRRPEELTRVRGIGPKTFNELRDYIKPSDE